MGGHLYVGEDSHYRPAEVGLAGLGFEVVDRAGLARLLYRLRLFESPLWGIGRATRSSSAVNERAVAGGPLCTGWDRTRGRRTP